MRHQSGDVVWRGQPPHCVQGDVTQGAGVAGCCPVEIVWPGVLDVERLAADLRELL